MRCPTCGCWLGAAKQCPRCKTVVTQRQENRNGSAPRGQFRGRIDQAGEVKRPSPLVDYLRAILRLLQDPRAPRLSRIVLFLTVLYIISPLDILPGGLIPVIGWIDDMIIGLLAWHFLRPDLDRYRDY